MASKTKYQIIQSAYSAMRVSGITRDPTPSDIETALVRLEEMAAGWDGVGVCIGYNFTPVPGVNDQVGADQVHHATLSFNLATILVADFNKQVPNRLIEQAEGSYAVTLNVVGRDRITMILPPNRAPRGTGNYRRNRWRRYAPTPIVIDKECVDINVFSGAIVDLYDEFAEYLNGETISTHLVEVTNGLTLSNDTINGTRVTYRITAGSALSQSVQTIKTTITTSSGRITHRFRTVTVDPGGI